MKHSHVVEPLNADTLRQAMRKDACDTLYVAMPQLMDVGAILVEAFYLDTKIEYVKDMQTSLPLKQNVYVLSPFIPAVQQWEWKAFSNNVTIGKQRHLTVNFKGLGALRSMDFPILKLNSYEDNSEKLQKHPELRLYRGTLKEINTADARN